MEIEDFCINVLGYRLKVRRLVHEERPVEDRPVLVIMHEGLGCIDMWHDFPSALAEATGCDALVFDRHGYGESDSLPHGEADFSYLYREAWEVLPEVLRVCGVDNCIFFGHSDGGTLSLLYAARYPEKVTAVISEAAHVYVDDLTVAGIYDALRAYETTDFKTKLVKYHGDNAEFMFRRWANTWLSEKHRDWTMEEPLKKINCPVLVIQGREDQYGTLGQVEAIAGTVSGVSEKLLIPECRHVPHHEKRDLVLDGVQCFLGAACSMN